MANSFVVVIRPQLRELGDNPTLDFLRFCCQAHMFEHLLGCKSIPRSNSLTLGFILSACPLLLSQQQLRELSRQTPSPEPSSFEEAQSPVVVDTDCNPE